jgi:2-polyprenyl-3-methyl-5-hydroxy-6-metoxy-1,4-benzoquinol methylase
VSPRTRTRKQTVIGDEEFLALLGGVLPEMAQVAARILERAGAYSVLCPACGGGKVGTYLARRGFRVTAYDSSAQTVTRAATCARQCGVEVDTFVDDAVMPRRALRRFDALYAGDLLSHLLASQRHTLLRSCHRALRQGGVVVVSVMSVDDERYGYGRMIEPDTFELPLGETLHFYAAHDLHAELSRHFVVTHIQDVVETQELPGLGEQTYRLLLAAAQKVDAD